LTIDNRQSSINFHLVAHRGGLYYRPENTLAAFEYIVERGIEWLETDVRLSRDDVPVLFHDEGISPPGSGYRFIRDLDVHDLKAIDVGGGELLPTLRDLLERFGTDICYDLDVKELDAVDGTISLIKEFEVEARTIITSFIPEALQRAREIAPELKRGFLLDRLTGSLVDGRHAVNAAKLLDCEYFLPHHRILSADWAQMAKDEGLKIVVWTVNRLPDARRLLNLGVDGFVSDRPDYLREAIKI